MKVFTSIISGIALASLGAALPQVTITPQVSIYDGPNFQGEGQTFLADGTCHSLFPWIESVLIPPGQFVFCQLFDNAECDGEGGDVILVSHAVHEIFSFASRHILPILRGSLDLPDLYQTRAFPFDDDELKLLTFLWSSKQHEDVLRRIYNAPQNTPESKEQLVLKGLTLRALRKEVAGYTGQKPIDGIIRSMLVLAVNDTATATETISRDPNPFKPSFTGLHALGFYGGRDYNPVHWENMHRLLDNPAGIQILRPFALAWQISVADVTNAVHTLRKPLYPMTDVYGKAMELDPPLVLFAPPDMLGDLRKPGSGFNELLLLEPPVHQKLVQVFAHVGELSYAVGVVVLKPYIPQLLELLADSRDLVHHRLFSLPNEDDTPDQVLRMDAQCTAQKQSLEFYLTCRLAVHLYATHVTFPIPRSLAARNVLLHSLCPKLQLLTDQGFSSPLFLWCASVALVASDETGPFPEILILFQKACCNLHVTSLPRLINLLHLFAWSHSAIQHHYSRMEGYLSDFTSATPIRPFKMFQQAVIEVL
ncbi:hypothetical protein BJY00DRAFT_318548 [Aspergillus carlsbadensis]|nr:hypothetical protein BJY00DRAFT_318548 [Aspergillus carlsbadensis]